MSEPTKTPFPGAAVAVTLCSVLLAGFGALSWLTALDRKERTTLEALEEPSAAGAPSVPLPPGAEPGKDSIPVLTLNGVPHYGVDIVHHSDGTMMKAGKDDTGQIELYQRIRRNKRKEELHVKLLPGRFLEVAPREEKPQKKDETAGE